jgi:hypothetical protein
MKKKWREEFIEDWQVRRSNERDNKAMSNGVKVVSTENFD